MKTRFALILTIVTVAGLTVSANAFINPPVGYKNAGNDCPGSPGDELPRITITNMIGDNDGYGYGDDLVPDGADLPLTSSPYEGGWLFDNRGGDELIGTDGSQFTDMESRFSPTFHHTFDMSLFSVLTEATFTIDISGVQQDLFGGYSHLYLDGVEVLGFIDLEQGAWGSGLLTYEVDLGMLSDGMLDIYIEGWDSNEGYYDDFAVDFASLTVSGLGVDPVPEPTTVMLFGLGLAGMGVARRFRKY